MDPTTLILLFVAGGIVLLIAELLLPTHGILGILGLLCLGGAIGVCFTINRWLGLGVFLGAILISPVVLTITTHLWAKSPIGRRIILPDATSTLAPSSVRVGQMGVAATDLRPMGECDFGDHRIETRSELGIIHTGQRVRVVALDHGRATVRAVEDAANITTNA